jgi:hypothetical protein
LHRKRGLHKDKHVIEMSISLEDNDCSNGIAQRLSQRKLLAAVLWLYDNAWIARS